jgi:hypothetical protein
MKRKVGKAFYCGGATSLATAVRRGMEEDQPVWWYICVDAGNGKAVVLSDSDDGHEEFEYDDLDYEYVCAMPAADEEYFSAELEALRRKAGAK